MADIVYEQISVHGREEVKIRTIDARKSGTKFLAREGIADRKAMRIALAEVIGETNYNTSSSCAPLTADGYANWDLFKEAFLKMEVDCWESSLKGMLKDETYIYAALHGQEIVGVVILVHLLKDFPEKTNPPEPPSTAFPDPSDWKAVEAYATSVEKQNELMNQVYRNLKNVRKQHGAGKIWELSGLGVKVEYRHQNIGRTLINHALSNVPRGHKVVMHPEPERIIMYQYLGFKHALSATGTAYSATMQPEWMNGGYLEIPMMILQK